MSRAYKCDICGKLYERFVIKGDYCLLQTFDSKKDLVRTKYLDLCSKCQEKLDEFIGLNKKEDQND